MQYYESKMLLALGYLLECLNSKDGEMQKLAHELKDMTEWEPPTCQDCKHFKTLRDDHKHGTCDKLQEMACAYSGDSYVSPAEIIIPRLFGCYCFENSYS